jgi:site-specific DNA recombinase
MEPTQEQKKLKSGSREYLLRPPGEWIVAHQPELRIVSDELWEKVKTRQRERAERIGARVRRGLSGHQARATGTYPKYLLSGLLKCGICGSNLVVSGHNQGYMCASRANGGRHVCHNGVRLPRIWLEKHLLKWISAQVLRGSACELRAQDSRAATDAEQARDCDDAPMHAMHERRLRHLRDQVSNLVDAIAQGALRSSPLIATRLVQLETELAKEETETPVGIQPVQRSVAQSVQFYDQFFATISERFSESAYETRSALSELVGGAVRLMPKEGAQELEVSCALGTTMLSR